MRRVNLQIFLIVIGFIMFGLLMVYDVSVVESFITFGDSTYFLRSQALWATIAISALIVVSKIPTKFWLKIGPLLFFGALILLLAVLVPGIGVKIAGARRWFSFGGFSLQPSELMKMGLIFYLATWLQKPRRFLSFILLVGGIFGLIMLQPDLGSALIIGAIATGMYVAAGKPLKHLLWLACGATGGIALLILISPYRMQRLTTFLNPESDPQGKSYHIRQITIALGNGGLFGKGLGQSKQKYRYIPEATTDSIFAIIAEELGFVACAMICMGYITLIVRMTNKVTLLPEERSESLLGVGIITWISAQVLVNLSSVVALIPLTGVPLPFVSYGGTALLSLAIAVGIFIGIPMTVDTKARVTRSRSIGRRFPSL